MPNIVVLLKQIQYNRIDLWYRRKSRSGGLAQMQWWEQHILHNAEQLPEKKMLKVPTQ